MEAPAVPKDVYIYKDISSIKFVILSPDIFDFEKLFIQGMLWYWNDSNIRVLADNDLEV